MAPDGPLAEALTVLYVVQPDYLILYVYMNNCSRIRSEVDPAPEGRRCTGDDVAMQGFIFFSVFFHPSCLCQTS